METNLIISSTGMLQKEKRSFNQLISNKFQMKLKNDNSRPLRQDCPGIIGQTLEVFCNR
jgi:hypothetical protein